jgi:hypothetical protein
VRGHDVMQGTRAEHVVVEGIDEPELVVRRLVGDRDHAGQERRRQARAADPVLRPVRPVREHLGLADPEAGVRVARHRDVGDRPHRRAAVVLGDARRHLALLVPRLLVQHAGAAAAARVVLRRAPRAVGQRRVRRLPAELVEPLAVTADLDAGAADPGDERDVGRELDGLRRQVGAAGGVVTVVSGGEVDGDARQRRLEGELVVEVHVRLAEQADVIRPVGPGVRDDVGDVVVDGAGPGVVQAAQAVGCADVDDLRAGSHGVHGLNVEGLLAVPALRPAQVDVVEPVRAGDDLAELAGPEPRLVVDAVVDLGVLQDRGRRVGVRDRHGRPVAVDAVGEQVRLTVGGLVLLRHVAAHHVRPVPAVRLRLVPGDLLPVVARARLHAVAGARGRARLGVRRLLQGRALVDADDAGDGARHGPRRGGRERERRRVGAQRHAPVAVLAQARPERPLDLGGRPGRLDVHAAAERLRDCEALCPEPSLDGHDLGARRRVAGGELGVRQPSAVRRARRLRHRLQRAHRSGLVSHAQEHAERDLLSLGRRCNRLGVAHPARCAAGKHVPRRRRRCGRPGQDRRREDGRPGEQHAPSAMESGTQGPTPSCGCCASKSAKTAEVSLLDRELVKLLAVAGSHPPGSTRRRGAGEPPRRRRAAGGRHRTRHRRRADVPGSAAGRLKRLEGSGSIGAPPRCPGDVQRCGYAGCSSRPIA